MVFNEGRFDQASLNTFYEQHSLYAAEMGVGSGGLNPCDEQRYAQALALLQRHQPAKDAHIVDVGCAKGGFLHTLKQHGYAHLRGVDLSRACVEHVRQAHGIDAAVGATRRLPDGDVPADVLVYSHVFEHLHGLREAVDEAHRKLADDGIVLVEIPDASRYGDYPVSDYYWLGQREHVNHLDGPHLKALMTRCGFHTEEIQETTMLMAAGVDNPIVRGVFRKAKPSETPASFVLRDRMTGYVTDQESSLAPRREQVAALTASKRGCYVWGIGLEFFILYTLADLRSCRIRCLIDNNPAKRERTVDGLQLQPQSHLERATADETIVLTSAVHGDVLQAELDKMSFSGDVLRLA